MEAIFKSIPTGLKISSNKDVTDNWDVICWIQCRMQFAGIDMSGPAFEAFWDEMWKKLQKQHERELMQILAGQKECNPHLSREKWVKKAVEIRYTYLAALESKQKEFDAKKELVSWAVKEPILVEAGTGALVLPRF